MTGWVDALARHSVFEPSTAYNALEGDELPRPESPNVSLPTVFGASSGKATRHPTRANYVEGNPKRKKKLLCVVRDTDLIVAVGKELRIVNLADVKARFDSNDDDASNLAQSAFDRGDYKTLDTPAVKFDIQQLQVNQTSKLLAVLGAHSVALVVLPRRGWSKSIGNSIECKSLPVGHFYHGLPRSPAVMHAAWHPAGQSSASLCVLTADGLLREYQVTDDTEEPAQTVSFAPADASSSTQAAPSSAAASKRKMPFASIDAEARQAVAFCFGSSRVDWSALTVYGLMRNGDVYALCPFLPRKAQLSASYIHSLSAVSAQEPGSAVASTSTALVQAGPSYIASDDSALAVKFVSELVRQARSAQAAEQDDSDPEPHVKVTCPVTFRGKRLVRQGPFLLQPAPAELDNGAESLASDIVYVASESLGVIVVTYSDGKVDILLETDPVVPKWMPTYHVDNEDEQSLPTLTVYESIDLGLSSMLEDNRQDPESLDSKEWPVLSTDPLYADTLYVHHSLGAHCLVLGWLDDLQSAIADASDDPSALSRLVKDPEPTGVACILKTASADGGYSEPPPVVACQVVSDVYLGYSLLLMTSSLQLVGIELSLRIDPRLLPSEEAFNTSTLAKKSSSSSSGVSDEPPAYVSLLSEPFKTPSLFTKPPVATRLALKAPVSSKGSTSGDGGAESLVINAESLRFMGKTVETFRHEIRDLVSSADVVQNRLELQIRELSRQLSKLRDLSDLTNELRTSTTGSSGAANRFERVEKAQVDLLKRTDRVLQRLMDAHAPELSIYEQKWFDELTRLEKEVRGGASDTQQHTTLEARAQRLQAQFEALKPALERLKQQRPEQDSTPDAGARLGSQQLQLIESRLSSEARMIAAAKDKLESMTAQVAAL